MTLRLAVALALLVSCSLAFQESLRLWGDEEDISETHALVELDTGTHPLQAKGGGLDGISDSVNGGVEPGRKSAEDEKAKKDEDKAKNDEKNEEEKSKGEKQREKSKDSEELPESAGPVTDGFKSGYSACWNEHNSEAHVKPVPQAAPAGLQAQVPPGYTLIPMSQLQALMAALPQPQLAPAPAPAPALAAPALAAPAPAPQLTVPQAVPAQPLSAQAPQTPETNSGLKLPKYKGVPGMALRMFDNAKSLFEEGKQTVHAVRDALKADAASYALASPVAQFTSYAQPQYAAPQYQPQLQQMAPQYQQPQYQQPQYQQVQYQQAQVAPQYQMNSPVASQSASVAELRQALVQTGAGLDESTISATDANEMMNG